VRQLRELDTDFLERQTDFLGKDDEGNAAEDGAWIPAMARPGPRGRDQSTVLIEP